MVKISRCMFSFYPIISFTDVCSISESCFNLGRLDRNTDTNDNIPTIDQTVMVWKRTRKSFSVRTGGFSYVYRSLSQKKKLVLLHCGNSNIRINFFIKPLIPAEVKIGINHIQNFYNIVSNKIIMAENIYHLESKRVENSVFSQEIGGENGIF